MHLIGDKRHLFEKKKQVEKGKSGPAAEAKKKGESRVQAWTGSKNTAHTVTTGGYRVPEPTPPEQVLRHRRGGAQTWCLRGSRESPPQQPWCQEKWEKPFPADSANGNGGAGTNR